MIINNVADPIATRNDEVFRFLSEKFPSAPTSAIQEAVDALERAEVVGHNDDVDLGALINRWLNDNPI
jgi:hypothetical protein